MRTAAILCLALSGCGGAQAGSTSSNLVMLCPTAACGGDPTGTWKAAAWCDHSYFPVGCNQTVDDSQVVESGALTFGADHSYTSTLHLAGPETSTWPKGCPYFGPDCAKNCSGFATTGATSADGSCVCSGTLDRPASSTGTWTATDSGGLTLSADQGITYQYCVQGDALILRADAPGLPTTAVFTRQ